MGLTRPYALGFLSCLILIGCAGFSYRYYGLSGVSYDRGMLLGPNDKDDLPFSRCAPDSSSKNKCVIMFAKDFFTYKKELEDTKMRLQECERGH